MGSTDLWSNEFLFYFNFSGPVGKRFFIFRVFLILSIILPFTSPFCVHVGNVPSSGGANEFFLRFALTSFHSTEWNMEERGEKPFLNF